jgi:hypothetical protein
LGAERLKDLVLRSKTENLREKKQKMLKDLRERYPSKFFSRFRHVYQPNLSNPFLIFPSFEREHREKARVAD